MKIIKIDFRNNEVKNLNLFLKTWLNKRFPCFLQVDLWDQGGRFYKNLNLRTVGNFNFFQDNRDNFNI